jgi:hypothetical protein
MPRDNLADSSRTMIKLGAVRGRAAQKPKEKPHRTDRSLCLENPRPKGGIFLPFGEILSLIFTLNQNRPRHPVVGDFPITAVNGNTGKQTGAIQFGQATFR